MRRENLILPGNDHREIIAAAPSPAKSVGDREVLERLYAAIQTMRASDRALVLLMLDGLAYREIAEITGLTETHIGVALTRARKRLAELMKGVTDELE
jgi:RNA polymerase sigma-70 factor (ECF subfamily)